MASRGRSSSSSLPESGAGILDYEKFEKEQVRKKRGRQEEGQRHLRRRSRSFDRSRHCQRQ